MSRVFGFLEQIPPSFSRSFSLSFNTNKTPTHQYPSEKISPILHLQLLRLMCVLLDSKKFIGAASNRLVRWLAWRSRNFDRCARANLLVTLLACQQSGEKTRWCCGNTGRGENEIKTKETSPIVFFLVLIIVKEREVEEEEEEKRRKKRRRRRKKKPPPSSLFLFLSLSLSLSLFFQQLTLVEVSVSSRNSIHSFD